MAFQRVGRVALKVFAVAVVLALLYPFVARAAVVLWSRAHVHPAAEAPGRRVALVLGARVYRSGRLSAMLADRVSAAAALYHAGKVDVLLMSGDNSSLDYNEPDAMREAAIALGVPAEDVFVDYAGRRTYDSCYRARHIFGVDDATVVTQEFHLPRALMLCRGLGIDAAGVTADDQRPWGYSRRSLTYSQIREFPATAVAVLDVLRRQEPPVMGEPIPILQGRGLD
ncbi:MAG TPA: ElyC/SanA/YdcF family protein [Aggregatilineales bacterium]|nr:ElyC/SanA/YdcF family protein [Aggregatilineales bacterium]